ncbi:CoB--CoM heterodisulfide reductase iron-sulfur subunit A family protein [Desulfolutivibrio sulfoxidireducens]|uniref:CoB--CoM heterodisulfide reductase iron-sulfur subunit A family protein n=1 Tax=Desulfolutivibrio sulfoxidireducens TaxID=2773299 RepID=UPI00159D46E6|nr:CoB--CoM heterodisulfide reductase iron-sulfur subunit A family protein [Desulfolutivibrio sulfoxidireducens]QLA14832.1 FAD-dependent oxidoreductase [Desulfolutivibrio sulfoxidireducens]QLA18403.1 FAD-dependent oxidoreductase [Desulfolutivibrio sulfoxidireducens]
MDSHRNDVFDAVVIGGGIAGLQAALDLAGQGYKTAVVEKDASIGGKMIRLSKVFPTLDCASCITTPKMAAAAHHDNITLFTCCDVKGLDRDGRGVTARITQRPRYVDIDSCIGCRKCEYACPVLVPDIEQGGFSGRKAIRIPFSNAIPQKAVLDVENCMLCGKCAKVCPTKAIRYDQKPEEFTIRARTAILATGFELSPLGDKNQYGRGEIPNVIDSLQMERLLAPHGPYGRVLRPSDGMIPDSIAYVQCAGSRDASMGVSYCSRVCCMYAIKQAMLLSGSLPLADITIYYMDIRAFGKNYEQFYQNAKAMGIEFVKAKVASLDAGEGGAVSVRFEDQAGEGVTTREHDLVVLSMGMLPGFAPGGICPVDLGGDGFIRSVRPKIAPPVTSLDGVFVAGVAAGPKDIVDTITEAGAAAMEAAKYLTALPASAPETAAQEAPHDRT